MTTHLTTSLSTLRLVTVLDRAGHPSLRPCVDGRDLLLGYANPKGLDPDALLPPLSTRLLPTREGATVVLGACACGETGCGSLSARVRREGGDVVWEPHRAPDETLDATYRFGLQAYLDAVDDATAARMAYPDADPVDDATGGPDAVSTGDAVAEGLGRRVARDVRHALRLQEQVDAAVSLFHVARIDWVSAWPWSSPDVRASVTTNGTQEVLTFVAQHDEDEDGFTRRVLVELDARRMPRSGRS